jgi:hypothetical protein
MLGTKYKVLYENLSINHVNHLLLNILMMIRRIVYGVNMIILYPSPYIQVTINSIFSFSICFFIIIYKPYRYKLDKFMNLYVELNSFLILTIIGAYIKEDLPYNIHESCELIILVLIYMSITIPALVNAFILLKDIILYLRRYFRKSRNEVHDESIFLDRIE